VRLEWLKKLNDYVRGAFEALSWVYSLIDDAEDAKSSEVMDQVECAMTDIRKGIAVNFRRRLKVQ
jgi:hypothetical protein